MSTSIYRGSGKLRGAVLQNIQSHKKTVLEFHPNVTVIVGDNRSGKTAFLRAVTCFTDFAPMKIRNTAVRDEEEGVLRLIFEDVVSTYRRKEREKNGKRELIDQKMVLRIGDTKHEFDRLGRGKLHPIIAEAVNMGAVDLDGFEIYLNMAGQHSPAFLLDPVFTGAVRLKILGTVNDQHLFDMGIRTHNAERKKVSGKVKHLAEDLRVNEEVLEQIIKEQDLTIIYETLQTSMTKVAQLEIHRSEATVILGRLTTRMQTIKKNEADLAALPSEEGLDGLIATIVGIQALERSVALHRDLLSRILRCRSRTQAVAKELESIPDVGDIEADIAKISDLEKANQKNRELLKRWKNYELRRSHCTSLLADHDQAIDADQAEIDRLVAKGAICPFFSSVKLQAPCRKAVVEKGVEV